MTVKNLTGLAGACQEAPIAVPDAIATVGSYARTPLGRQTCGRQGLHDAHGTAELFVSRRRLNQRPCI